jgi:RNA polymerase sigma-70 factor (ECF subfamily)
MGDDGRTLRFGALATRVRPGYGVGVTRHAVEASPIETDDDAAISAEAAAVAAAVVDRRALAPLYRRYAPEVYRFCLRRLRTREAAEDATSLVFERVLTSLHTFRGGAFAPWLFAIAHNTVVNITRRRSAVAMPDHYDATDPAIGPEAAAVASADAQELWRLLDALPDDQRQVIELRLAGLRGPEIAAALGRSPGAVRMLQFRAMTRLRAAFESHDPERWEMHVRENDHDQTG